MKESKFQKVIDVLLFYNIREDFQINKIDNGESITFLQLFASFINRKYKEQQPVDGECILSLIIEFLRVEQTLIDQLFMKRLIQLFRYTHLKNRTICKIFDILRVSAQKFENIGDDPDDALSIPIPIDYHTDILEVLNTCLVHDDPPHIIFPGDKDSFLQVSSIPWTFSKGYTLAMWIKIPSHSVGKGFELFRCRSPTMKMDGAMSGMSEDGVYAVRVVISCEGRGQDEVRGKVVLGAGAWHLITFTHATVEETDRLTVTVDGHLEIQSELAFPVVPNTQETHWTFGVSFTGKFAAVTLYEQDLPLNSIQFLNSLGPSVADLSQGVSFPQTSYDTGHVPLGSLSAKGPKWSKWCKITSAFTVTATAVASNYSVPQTKIGKQYADFIVMVPLTYERDTPLLASLTGRCELVLVTSFLQAFIEAGGILLPIYLLWTYSCHKFEEKKEIVIDYQPKHHYFREVMIRCLQCLRLLLFHHIDLKEQFLQCHGFHLIAHSLASMSTESKKYLLDKDFVDSCFDVIESLGPDGLKGDGIATALQGFLFDFRIWNHCSLPLLQYYLEQLSNLCLKAGDYLYKTIGIQRILDLFRIHVSKMINGTSAISSTGIKSHRNAASSGNGNETRDDNDEIEEEDSQLKTAKNCADEFYKLLMIAKEAAQAQAQRLKSNIIPEVDAMLMCLVETSNPFLIERILRIFANIRVTSPASLQQSLITNRYYDTLIVNLWMKKGLTLEVRTQAVINLFWLLNTELKPLPLQLIQQRKKIRALFTPVLVSSGGLRGKVSNNATGVDANKLKTSLEQLKMVAKPLPKHWRNLMMLSEVMLKALADGLWGAVVPSCLELVCNEKIIDHSDTIPIDLHPMLSSIMGENQDDVWLLLPFLPGLLSRVPLEIGEKIVMQIHLQFKTDEGQCEAINAIEDKLWMKYILDLAVIGIFQNHYHTADCIAITWTQLPTYTELAIDILATILEYKIKYCSMEGFNTWMMLKFCINERCQQYFGSSTTSKSELVEFLDRRFMKRCTLLTLQKLTKTNDDGWTPYILDCLDNILQVLQENILFTKSQTAEMASKSSTTSLLDLDENTTNQQIPYLIKQEEDILLISLLIDLTEMIRKSGKKFSYFGHEWIIWKRSLIILIESMHLIDESLMAKFSQEMIQNLYKLSEPGISNYHVMNKKEFTQLIFDALFAFENIIQSPVTSTALRMKATGAVFSIISLFSDIREKYSNIGNTSGSNNSALPPHLEDILKKLLLVEHINDIELLFAVLRTSQKEANHSVISFEEEDNASVSSKASQKLNNKAAKNANSETSMIEEGKETIQVNANTPPNLLDDALLIAEGITPLSENSESMPSDTSTTTSSKKLISEGVVVVPEDEKQKTFLAWLKIRQGIITDRVDSEKSRLSRAKKTQEANSEATKRYWKKAKRKTESEYFLETHQCQWKLGICHEGQFFGRKRLVLRPRFEFPLTDPKKKEDEETTDLNTSRLSSVDELDISTEELNKILTKDYLGYIKDVTRGDGTKEIGGNNARAPSDEKSRSTVENSEHGEGNMIPGTGWGIVDADGSEEGFGVIGIAKDANPEKANAATSAKGNNPHPDSDEYLLSKAIGEKGTDLISELIHTEEALNAMKGVIETGPSHSGITRFDANPIRLEAKVVMVTASGNCWGYLQLNDDELFFRSSFGLEDARKDDNAAVNITREQRMRRRRWRIDAISAVYLRRYRLRDSALELFFRKGKHRNVFFDFGHTREDAKLRNEFSKMINQLAPSSAFKQTINMTPFRMVYEHGVQEKWLNGKMSNFDYLMALNTIAGRTYNDLCQYPVMPWVLSDYESEKLDLNNPAVYRDLSKPMGALNETRLKEFLDRFYSFEENVSSGIPAFMYGSHYSTMVGVVLHFLVRLQPFASLHKEMQNGHFDVPDRLFSSIPRSYYHNTTQLSEVKEITPEWYTTPDMFRNINHFDFGLTQDGESIADVELPKWAKSAEDFVKLHRDALESDYVTEHLHEWIDLIFGYKQRGPDSVEAHNVFYYLTYYGAVDHYAIQDETIRKATELQIAHFGQVPLQLFKVPHPARRVSGPNAVLPISRMLRRSFSPLDLYKYVKPKDEEEQLAHSAPSTLIFRKSQSVIIHCAVLVDRILCILDNGVIEMLKYSTSEEAKTVLANSYPPVGSKNSGGGGGNTSNSVKRNSNTASSSKATSSAAAVSLMDDLLLLDHPDIFTAPPTSGKEPASEFTSDHSISSSSLELICLREGDPLIAVEKEYIHFETVPRVPITKFTRLDRTEKFDKDYFEKLFKAKPAIVSCESNAEFIARHVTLSRSCKLCFSIGSIDGSIAIREMDGKTGFIKSCADFHAHKRKVISIAVDTTPDYQIIASCDEGGLILVWTIIPPNPNHANRSVYAISRRPQRLFRVEPHPDMHIDISWQMGIVIAVTGITVKIFSIERNELLRTFTMKFSVDNTDVAPNTSSAASLIGYQAYTSSTADEIMYEWSVNGPADHLFGRKKYLSIESEDLLAPKYITRRFVMSDYGVIIVHMEAFVYLDSLLEYEDQLQMQHLLVAYTISGVRTAIITPFSPITCLVCPDRGEVVIAGQRDGSIVFYQAQDLTILHKLQPSSLCIALNLALPGATGGSSGRKGNVASNRDSTVLDAAKRGQLTRLERGTDTTAIISISVGPNRISPTIIVASTEAGNIYFKAFPDFIKWERNRTPSALAQLASVPLQAVKGTLLQAQNWTAETAGVFAQNARSLADEALTELKKVSETSFIFSLIYFAISQIKRSSIVKGVASFFGMGSQKSNTDSHSSSTNNNENSK